VARERLGVLALAIAAFAGLLAWAFVARAQGQTEQRVASRRIAGARP